MDTDELDDPAPVAPPRALPPARERDACCGPIGAHDDVSLTALGRRVAELLRARDQSES